MLRLFLFRYVPSLFEVYVGCMNVYDETTGAFVWISPTPQEGKMILRDHAAMFAKPAIGVVLTTGGKQLYASDPEEPLDQKTMNYSRILVIAEIDTAGMTDGAGPNPTQNPTHEILEGRLIAAFRRLSIDDQARLVDDVEAMTEKQNSPKSENRRA